MAKVYITGVSGTGKTTLAAAFAAEGYHTVSIDEADLCLWVSKDSKTPVNYEAKLDQEFVDKHDWICDGNKLRDILATQEDILVFGIASNQNEFLDAFDKVIVLKCNPDIFIQRIVSRVDNDFGKDESIQKYLRDTHGAFENDLVARGAIEINTEQPVSQVVSAIKSLL
jgi:adenylate kinase family enzyme